MREIKFRNMVYREQCKDWVTYYHTLQGLVENSDMDVFENVWEQYTGLKDKNGKEIYEGDIVSEHNGDIIGKVTQKPSGEYCISWIGIFGGSSVLYDETSMCEVIGNIHENGDLLK